MYQFLAPYNLAGFRTLDHLFQIQIAEIRSQADFLGSGTSGLYLGRGTCSLNLGSGTSGLNIGETFYPS
jgi:hypothetical protein